MSRRPPLVLVAAVAAVALVVGVGEATTPDVRRPSSRTRLAPVIGSVSVCPELLEQGNDVTTKLTVGTAVPGSLTVRAANVQPGSGVGPVVLNRGGIVDSFGSPGTKSVAIAATAVGTIAGAVEAQQVSRGVDGVQRGLAGTRCTPTAQDTWFIGGSTGVGFQSDLVLVNPYEDEALVELELIGTSGVIDVPAARGIVVRPRNRMVVDLASLAPNEHGIAVRVVVREGRVASAFRDARTAGDVPRGVDWVPPAGRPTFNVDLAGAPPGNGRRLLYLAVPGEDDALVRVQLTTEDGQFVPAGLDEIEVPGGRLGVVDITKAVAGRPVSVRVLAEGGAVLASLLVENRARYNPIQEFAYIGASTSLSGPALVTDARVTGDDLDTYLLLSAPRGTGRVRVSMVQLGLQQYRLPKPLDVTIPAGRLRLVQLSSPQLAMDKRINLRPFLVTPLPGSSPVYASRVIYELGLRGPLFTALQLEARPVAGVPVPDAVADPAVPVRRVAGD